MQLKKHKLIVTPEETEIDLNKLGIDPTLLLAAIKAGVGAFRNEDEFAAKSAAGYNAWNTILKTLRYELKLSKWGESFYENGVEGVISNLRKVVIIVNSGDSNTGIENSIPRPKNHKGTGYDKMMENNLDLLESPIDLFEHNSVVDEPIDPNQTWIFLYFIDIKNKQVRYELSLPTHISNNSIGGWKKRIRFTPFDISDEPIVTSNSNKEVDTNEIDFDVTRKSS